MSKIKHALFNTFLPIIIYGSVIGLLTGFIVWFYSYSAEWVSEQSKSIYSFVGENLQFLPLLLVGVGCLGLFSYLFVKVEPDVQGSGIPYAEGAMRGLLSFKWWRMMLCTMASSMVSFFAGLPLGVEGPSVLVGSTIGSGVNVLTKPLCKKNKAWKRLSITGGASAGIATVFKAPLTGIIFALEEGHKRFSPMILLTAASSVICASIVSYLLGMWVGSSTFFFEFEKVVFLPWDSIGLVALMGLMCGLFSALFSLVLYKSRDFFTKYEKKINKLFFVVGVFVLVGLVGVFIPETNGGGYSIVGRVAEMDFTWKMLILIIAVRLVLTVLCVNSVATGGLFLPMLAIGAMFGGLIGHMFIYLGVSEQYYSFIVILSMCSFLGAVIRAPLTSIILTVEITGQFASGFLFASISVAIAYFVVEFLHIKPFYDKQLSIIEKRKHANEHRSFFTFDVEVDADSFACGKNVRDILWPADCVIFQIRTVDSLGNAKVRMDRDGERIIKPGDKYTIRANTYNLEKTKRDVLYLVQSPKNYSDNNDELKNLSK